MITINPTTGERGVYNRTPNPEDYPHDLLGEKVIVIKDGKVIQTEIVKQTKNLFCYISEKAEYPYLDDELEWGVINAIRKVNEVLTYNKPPK